VIGVQVLSAVLQLKPAPSARPRNELPELTGAVRKIRARAQHDLGTAIGSIKELAALLELKPVPSVACGNQLPKLTGTVRIVRAAAHDDLGPTVVRVQIETADL
jgi:hypothetical protein